MQLERDMLVRAAIDRNIRSILFHVKPATTLLQGPVVENAIRALKTHGYLLGLIGDTSTSDSKLLKEFHFVHNDKSQNSSNASVYATASEKLNVSLDRTLLVTESTPQDDDINEAIIITLPSESMDPEPQPLVQFVKDFLNFDQCLDPTGRCFGPFRIAFSQVFYESTLSFALVNLKPIFDGKTRLGHVLMVPKRPVARFDKLDVDEVSDLWASAQLVGKQVERHYGASSLTFTIQDGKDAGQTVPHVHIHIIPRITHDFKCNDDIYPEIEKHEQSLYMDNESRSPRSEREMAVEASHLRRLFS